MTVLLSLSRLCIFSIATCQILVLLCCWCQSTACELQRMGGCAGFEIYMLTWLDSLDSSCFTQNGIADSEIPIIMNKIDFLTIKVTKCAQGFSKKRRQSTTLQLFSSSQLHSSSLQLIIPYWAILSTFLNLFCRITFLSQTNLAKNYAAH